MAFFGRYIEVTPHSRLVWTNDEGGEGGAVTTVTFEERGGETLVVMHDLYPSKEALDGAIASGSTSGLAETFEQLDELLVTLGRERGAVMKSLISPSARHAMRPCPRRTCHLATAGRALSDLLSGS